VGKIMESLLTLGLLVMLSRMVIAKKASFWVHLTSTPSGPVKQRGSEAVEAILLEASAFSS